jgi:hypothetical protein
MKKIVTYSMVIVILFSLTEFHEFAKIPFAIGHFIEHYSENSDTTVINFLSEHYSNNDDNTEEHSSLPFKEHCTCVAIQFLMYLESNHTTIVLTFSKLQYFLSSNTSTELGTNLGVWQPPQLTSPI